MGKYLFFPVSVILTNISNEKTAFYKKKLYQSQIGFPQGWNEFWGKESDNTIS